MSQGVAVNRRASPRSNVEIEALVVVPKRFHTLAAVVDLSVDGCQIRLTRPLDLPPRFIVEFNGMAYLCERRWVEGASLGLQFIDALSRAQRKELAGILATPRV